MFAMQKSALFMRQWQNHAQEYKDRADVNTAKRFIASVEKALRFIHRNPYACPLYDTGEETDDLRMFQFRKWNLHGFPHMVLFRLHGNATILIEVLYRIKWICLRALP